MFIACVPKPLVLPLGRGPGGGWLPKPQWQAALVLIWPDKGRDLCLGEGAL